MKRRPSTALMQRAKRIRVLLMDVDGVLTDGRIWLQSWPDGTAHEIKEFSAYDGQGMMLARTMGLCTGVITGRESPAVARRAKEMGLEFVYQGQAAKTAAFEEILAKSGARAEEVCYVADDLPDLPVLARVGLAVAVANAEPEVKRAAHYVTRRSGGDGAVREVVELILKAQGKWAQAIREAHA
jgi:3-deoxy-D-manno-octulosonate 8-phosphate phosphatase (KDO 8-P phosphatase)